MIFDTLSRTENRRTALVTGALPEWRSCVTNGTWNASKNNVALTHSSGEIRHNDRTIFVLFLPNPDFPVAAQLIH